MTTRLWAGSAQAAVPVKPKCPKASVERGGGALEVFSLPGLSQPKPRPNLSASRVNVRTVGAEK